MNIPASLSDSGSRRRRYFPTRDKAKAEAARLRALREEGRQAVDIRAALAEDAEKAAKILKGFGVSLTQAAKFYERHHDKRAKAPTMDEAWKASIDRRPNHRERTISDYRAWRKALPGWFMALNVHDIEPPTIEKALNETTVGKTRWKAGHRYIRAVLGDCVKSGQLDENPAKRVHLERARESDDDVSIYSVDELKDLFGACRLFEEKTDRDCRPCAIAFAFMAFAGIRPDEVTKLRWDDVNLELENIRIGSTVAKKARRRNVRIQPTLAAWIQGIPENERQGKIVPARWRYKAARVRKEAGIDGREKQDALRHSFGSYLLATENDLDSLKADMGHEHVRVFFDHYHNAMTKREALPYWQVLPPGVSLKTIKAQVA